MANHPEAHSHDGGHAAHGQRSSFDVKVLRQDGPGESSYWERHRVPYERDMNITSVLQRIAAQAATADGAPVAPVAYDANCLEEVCGSCTMLINGRTRQACTALVDKLLEDNAAEIELRPMSKFPVVRDLMVDRQRLFRALEKVRAWAPVEGYYDAGPGPRMSQDDQQLAYQMSQCMKCGCCLEACPQYTKVELTRRDDESEVEFNKRKQATYDQNFIGAHAISQAVMFNLHPTGKMNAKERVDALTAEGGVQVCGNAQNCVAVCPKLVPLTTSIAKAGRAATVRSLKRFFDS